MSRLLKCCTIASWQYFIQYALKVFLVFLVFLVFFLTSLGEKKHASYIFFRALLPFLEVYWLSARLNLDFWLIEEKDIDRAEVYIAVASLYLWSLPL